MAPTSTYGLLLLLLLVVVVVVVVGEEEAAAERGVDADAVVMGSVVAVFELCLVNLDGADDQAEVSPTSDDLPVAFVNDEDVALLLLLTMFPLRIPNKNNKRITIN